MNIQNKLRLANALMLLGIVPLLMTIIWLFSTASTFDSQKHGQVVDLMMLLGKMGFAYMFALIVCGSGAVWSSKLAKRNGGTGARTSRAIRIGVAIVLIAPFVLRAL